MWGDLSGRQRGAARTFAKLKPDLRGLAALPGAISAARKGDDALLAFLLQEFEKEGFSIEGAHQVMAALTLGVGPLGRHRPGADRDLADIARALQAARAIGRLDAGQAAVSCEGLILALEAQEGTDALLERVAGLPGAIRGAPDASPRASWPRSASRGRRFASICRPSARPPFAPPPRPAWPESPGRRA